MVQLRQTCIRCHNEHVDVMLYLEYNQTKGDPAYNAESVRLVSLNLKNVGTDAPVMFRYGGA